MDQQGQSGIKCSKCDAVLEDQDQLEEHMRRDHSTEGIGPESGSTEGGRMESGGQMTPP
jgi:hypothetical protein